MKYSKLTLSPRVILLGLMISWPALLGAQESIVQANHNTVSAGTLTDNVLTVNLVAEQGMWYPAGEEAHGFAIQAFREAGKALQIPGPMIRVEEGTEVVATIRNAIADSDLRLIGFQSRPANSQNEITIVSGEEKTVRFTVGEPGTYFYAAGTESPDLAQRFYRDSQLSGAFIVDPKGYKDEDLVLVLNDYLRGTPPNVTGTQTGINGMTWPNSIIQEVEVGKTNRWHIINPSFAIHPMHLHGQHYRVTSTSSLLSSTRNRADEQAEIVTQPVPPMSAMTMEWAAVQEGNWLFHCHLSAHVSAELMVSTLGDVLLRPPEEREPLPSLGMGGMVLGIRAVDPQGLSTATNDVTREITMLMEKQDNYFGDEQGFTVAFNEANKTLKSPVAPGPMLILNKDEAVSINLLNNLDQPTSIHWHGMELESYYDGVAGYSGNGTSITPIINPGESFEVRMKPPRAGTYFYHTHFNDGEQLRAGLYGGIVVSDPAAPYTPAREKLLVLGLIGQSPRQGMGFNGENLLLEQFQLNREYKLRLVNITENGAGVRISLKSERGAENWTPIAKDGADLPEALQLPKEASAQRLVVGEAYDYSWTPTTPGVYEFEARSGNGRNVFARAEFTVAP